MTVDVMKEAYGMIYEIETHLRTIIKKNMEEKYGYAWPSVLYEKNCEKKAYYNELVTLFGRYPGILPHFTKQQRDKLYSLTPIRNKIAHSHVISEKEFNFLISCHKLVTKQPIKKRRKSLRSNIVN